MNDTDNEAEMTDALKVYLAGPDVFLPDALDVLEQKKKICAKHGFLGVSPLDNEADGGGMTPMQLAMHISRGNEQTMDACDLIVANMTPFRGPSMDVGTAYEMGYMRAQKKPIYGYSNDPAPYADRVAGFFKATSPAPFTQSADGRTLDPHGLTVEAFGLADNLMMVGAIDACGGQVHMPSSPVRDPGRDMVWFEQAVESARTLKIG